MKSGIAQTILVGLGFVLLLYGLGFIAITRPALNLSPQTTLWTQGFDSGTLPSPFWNNHAAGCGYSVTGVSAHDGSYGVSLTTDGLVTNEYSWVESTLDPAGVATYPDVLLTAWFKFPSSLPTGTGIWNIMQLIDTGYMPIAQVRIYGAGHTGGASPTFGIVYIKNGNSVEYKNGIAVVLNTWYNVQLHVKRATGTAGACELYVDSSMILSDSGFDNSLQGTPWGFTVGVFDGSGTGTPRTVYVDTIMAGQGVSGGGVPPPTQYTLSTSIVGNGSVNPDTGAYNYNAGTNVSVTAYATDFHYVFTCFTVDGTNVTANPVSVTMNMNHNVVAVFSAGPNPNPTPPPTQPLITKENLASVSGIGLIAGSSLWAAVSRRKSKKGKKR